MAGHTKWSEIKHKSAVRERETHAAEVIARLAHWAQIDKAGAPYIEHVARVAATVPPAARAAAWLHDVLEDSTFNAEMLRAAGISAETVASVQHLTRDPAVEYLAYIDALCSAADIVALTVKQADLLDHLNPHCPGHLRERYVRALARVEGALAMPGVLRGLEASGQRTIAALGDIIAALDEGKNR